MTDYDFSDLTPPPGLMAKWIAQCKTPDSVGRYNEAQTLMAAYRAGAEQAAERLKGQWPEPITDRPPTEADGDEDGRVQVQCLNTLWDNTDWTLAFTLNLPWLHTPRWQPPAPPTLKQKGLFSLAVLQSYDETCTPAELEEHWNNVRRALEAES